MNVRSTPSGLMIISEQYETHVDPYKSFNLKALMKKQSQGKFLKPDEKNFVLGHAERIRKQRQNKISH